MKITKFSNKLYENKRYRPLIDSFPGALSGRIKLMQKDLDNQQWESFYLINHKIKGIAGSLGYPQLSDITEAIQGELTEKKYADIAVKFETLKSMVVEILNEWERHRSA